MTKPADTNSPSFLIEVAIPVPMRQLFTYQVPDKLNTNAWHVGERVIVPFAGRNLVGIVMELDVSSSMPSEKIKSILQRVADPFHFPASLLNFLKTCANYYHHPIGDVLQQALPVSLRQIEEVDLSLPSTWECTEAGQNSVDDLPKSAKRQQELLAVIQNHSALTWVEIRTLGFTKAQLNALAKKALIKEVEGKAVPFAWQDNQLNQHNKLSLSVEQSVVVSAIKEVSNHFSCHLVDGVTGSGKTEVYLQTMELALSQSKQVLLLVPEIGLTPQTLSRFEQRFNIPIYLHHSGLNNSERLQTWLAAQRNSAAIVIGTRSAIFSPLQNLGLIIVDEEHDASFKQQDTFRYHARDMAILRARQLDIPIILGSATPSFESLQNALQKKYHYHQLLKRAGSSRKSPISLIDMSQQQVEHGLSGTLKKAIKTTLERNEQVLLFLNRRGYAPAISCQECHWIAHCPRCNKPFTYHQGEKRLVCHHCGFQKRIPNQCPDCGSVRIQPLGQGTEQLEERIKDEFAEYSAVRIDRDSTRRKGELAKLLQEVADKKHQLLIGTQMLAKGHHFPDVTLVAMLDVDGALFSYDFRAAEQMAQLLIQVAGRAGRDSKPGKVMVQTQYPQHPLLQDLVHNGYKHFAQQGLMERKSALLPPFAHQVLIRAEANYPSYPEQFLREITQHKLANCMLAGPLPAAMEKKAGKYRFHLIVQAKNRKDLHHGIAYILASIPHNPWQNKVRWSLDVDPTDLTW